MKWGEMTLEVAKGVAAEAQTKWDKATTKDEAAEIIATYGAKIGYKPLIKILIKKMNPDEALKVYNK